MHTLQMLRLVGWRWDIPKSQVPSSNAVRRISLLRRPRMAAGAKHSAAMPKRSADSAFTEMSCSAILMTTCSHGSPQPMCRQACTSLVQAHSAQDRALQSRHAAHTVCIELLRCFPLYRFPVPDILLPHSMVAVTSVAISFGIAQQVLTLCAAAACQADISELAGHKPCCSHHAMMTAGGSQYAFYLAATSALDYRQLHKESPPDLTQRVLR